MNDSVLDRVEDAVAACRAGRLVIVVDDEDRENEGDLVVAAEHATPAAINFMATHGRGLICLAMEGAMLDRLQIPMMVPEGHNTSGFETGFTISVEAASGVSTGISAPDRAHTIRTLIDPASTRADIAMPGHVFPLRARAGGVLERRGQTEASVDLARLAGLVPAGVICEVMREDGEMMRLPELLAFAREHALPVISVEQLVRHRHALQATVDAAATPPVVGGDGSGNADGTRTGPDAARAASGEGEADGGAPTAGGRRTVPAAATVVPIARTRLPTAHGPFDVAVFRDAQGLEHSALIRGEPSLAEDPPLVRLHSECLTGDTFGSLRCDCGEQLQEAMRRVDERGCGIVLYLRQEGRGIGLGNKLRAYALQDDGLDTVEANHALGFPADARHYDVAAAMLAALGLHRIRLLSNNPDKSAALAALGVVVAEREPLVVAAQPHNAAYLRTKSERMGHDLSVPGTEPDTAPDTARDTAPGGRTTATDETH